MLTVRVVELAGDLWTDGGTDGRSEGWLSQKKKKHLDRQTSPPTVRTLYSLV